MARVRYRVEHRREGYTPDEMGGTDDWGGCDDLIIGSIMRDPYGATSTAWVSVDGAAGPHRSLPPSELFAAWVLMARRLMEDPGWDVDGPEARLCRRVFEVVRDAKLRGRAPAHGRETP